MYCSVWLKSGTLRVFVDDATVIEADLDSRVTKRIAGINLRKGGLRDSFEVEPGRHEIRVRVAWGGNVKNESIWANFQPGSKRRLIWMSGSRQSRSPWSMPSRTNWRMRSLRNRWKLST